MQHQFVPTPRPLIQVTFWQSLLADIKPVAITAEEKNFMATVQRFFTDCEGDSLSYPDHFKLAMLLARNPQRGNLEKFAEAIKQRLGIEEFNEFEKFYRAKKERNEFVTIEDFHIYFNFPRINYIPQIPSQGPLQVDIKDIDDEGRLRINRSAIRKLIYKKIKEDIDLCPDASDPNIICGQISQTELVAELKIDTPVRVIFNFRKDDPGSLFVGYVYEKSRLNLTKSTLQLLQDDDSHWHVVKTPKK